MFTQISLNRKRLLIAGAIFLLFALVITWAFVVAGGQSDTAPKPSASVAPSASLSPEKLAIAQQDPQERDPVLRSQAEAEVASRPAFQKLPYSKGDVFIYHVDAAPDGRAILEVVYSGTRETAETVYREFLRQNNDPGTAYVVRYLPNVH